MELTPELVLRAYSVGLFPMAEQRDGPVSWFEPRVRGILPLERLRVSRSLRKVVNSQRFVVSYNRAFRQVIATCADREPTWISHEIERVYTELHTLGFAHSVEVWREEQLVGGLYGVALGGAFFGESMFHHATDASKVGFVYLVRHLRARGFRLLDMQYLTDHLQSLGGEEMRREAYLPVLEQALCRPVRFHPADAPSGVFSTSESFE